jgi:hypothetical protein
MRSQRIGRVIAGYGDVARPVGVDINGDGAFIGGGVRGGRGGACAGSRCTGRAGRFGSPVRRSKLQHIGAVADRQFRSSAGPRAGCREVRRFHLRRDVRRVGRNSGLDVIRVSRIHADVGDGFQQQRVLRRIEIALVARDLDGEEIRGVGLAADNRYIKLIAPLARIFRADCDRSRGGGRLAVHDRDRRRNRASARYTHDVDLLAAVVEELQHRVRQEAIAQKRAVVSLKFRVAGDKESGSQRAHLRFSNKARRRRAHSFNRLHATGHFLYVNSRM